MVRGSAAILFVLLMTPAAWAQDGAAIYTEHCAECHEAGVRAPSRAVIAALPVDRIVAALESGLMRVQGEALSVEQRRTVAAYISTVAPVEAKRAAKACTAPTAPMRVAATDWPTWGITLENERFHKNPGLTAAQVPALKTKWAFGFEGENAAAANPTIVGNRVFIGSGSGNVFALGLDDGCTAWTFKADGGVRAAIVVGEPKPGAGVSAFVGDLRATIYSLDPSTGELRWKRKLDDHRAARITGTPVLHDGRLYVPISSVEEAIGAQPTYECCTFRGSLVAIDATDGSEKWRTYLIGEPAKQQGTNSRGVALWGPSGVAVWGSPTIDPRTRSVYVATGDSYSQPAAPMSDSIVGLDLDTGAIKWFNQATEGDAFNMACGAAEATNCPDKAGPDHDFGQPPILVTLPNGKRLLLAGQKSGIVHALDPDDNGRRVWSRPLGRGGVLGGIEWGSASDGQLLFVPMSDITFKEQAQGPRSGLDSSVGGGLFAIRVADGSTVWSTRTNGCADRPSCSPALSSPAAAIPGVVFSGSIDGHFRAYAAGDGAVIWDVDTARDFETVNGVAAHGGSIDVGGPAIANGVVVTTSGYGTWGGMRGNVLIAFTVDGK